MFFPYFLQLLKVSCLWTICLWTDVGSSIFIPFIQILFLRIKMTSWIMGEIRTFIFHLLIITKYLLSMHILLNIFLRSNRVSVSS